MVCYCSRAAAAAFASCRRAIILSICPRTLAVRSAPAFSGLPDWNGGSGLYSRPSWMA